MTFTLGFGIFTSVYPADPPTLTPGPDGFSMESYDIILTNDRICRSCRIRPAGVDVSNFRLFELMDGRGYRGIYREEDLLGLNTQPKKRWFARKQIEGVGLPGKVISPHAYDYDKDSPPLPYYYK